MEVEVEVEVEDAAEEVSVAAFALSVSWLESAAEADSDIVTAETAEGVNVLVVAALTGVLAEAVLTPSEDEDATSDGGACILLKT